MSSISPPSDHGVALPEPTRTSMEDGFGADFSDVRVHVGTLAAASAESIGADAYTAGRDIHFGEGKYAPASRDGQRLLAHELAHTVQQFSPLAPHASPSSDIPVGQPDSPLEAEADRAAEDVLSGKRPLIETNPTAGQPALHTPANRGSEGSGDRRGSI